MSKITKQIKKWRGEFGNSYTKRNRISINEIDKNYIKRFQISKTAIYNKFTKKLPRSIKILEIGSNIGNQLLILQKLGFKNLYGIEINKQAISIAKKRVSNINIIEGLASDIPFKDNFFKIVFTSGVLIHIAPGDIKSVIAEMCRCTSKYILGLEYYAKKYTPVLYRGHKNLLWKSDFSKLFMNNCPQLKLIKEIILQDKKNNL